MKVGALCAGAAALAGAAQADAYEESDPAFRALLSAIEARDAAAIETISRRDIVSMRHRAVMPAWELVAMLEGCAIASVRPAEANYQFIRFACPARRARVAQGSCDSGDLSLAAQAIGGRIRLSLDALRADRPECIPPPPPPPAPPRRPKR